MSRIIIRVKSLAFFLWHSRHEFYHVFLGLVWVWVLSKVWGMFQWRWVIASVVGSILPDLEHITYQLGRGKGDPYSQTIKQLFLFRKWRQLVTFIEKGHKHNTSLAYHNIYTIMFLAVLAVFLYKLDVYTGTVFAGAMVIHYLFDIADDLVQLGRINTNWMRWGKGKSREKLSNAEA